MLHTQFLIVALGIMISFSSATVNANSLSLVGNGLVYDSASNIKWTVDGNLLGTMESGSADLASIIMTEVSSVTDSQGNHTLINSDFGSNGDVSWYGAEAFVAYLDHTKYQGYSNWVMPSLTELATLFNTNLGEAPGSSITTNHNSDYGLFSNIQTSAYWSGTEQDPSSSFQDGAWYFVSQVGLQVTTNKFNKFSAWAVSPGNVSSVPVPAAIWLFGTGILGLIGFKRRKH